MIIFYILSKILILRLEGPITPSSASYIKRELKGDYDYAVIEIDTPGGLDRSMRTIVKSIINSPFPVIGYVYPRGARCASAGVFILTACHVAAMSPGTSVGAAHPVSMGGKMDDEMKKKVTNDAVSYLLSLAEMRERNKDILRRMVEESYTCTAREALEYGLIDLVVDDLDALIKKLDGYRVNFGDTVLILKSSDDVEEKDPGLIERILDIITQPEVAYILLLIGIYGIIFELKNPGSVLPGVVGFVCIVLALYSLNLLPINYTGLILIVLGIVMFILELHITSYGLLTIGGVVSFLLGSLMLFPERRLSMYLIIIALVMVGVFTFIFYMVLKAHRRKPMTGMKGMIGLTGEVREELNPEGMVFVNGEWWKAVSSDGSVIGKGEKVVVVEVEGLTLKVKKKGG